MKPKRFIFVGCFLFLFRLTPLASDYARTSIIYQVTPVGIQQGTTATITVEGINLQETSQLLFSERGVKARILDIQEVPNKPYTTPKQRVRIEVGTSTKVEAGVYGFRLKTSFGTTNWVPFAIGRLREVAEAKSTHSVSEAQQISLPATVNGALEHAGEADYFRFDVSEGQQLVFEVLATALGSKLDSVLTLLDAQGQVLATNDNFALGSMDSLLSYKFPRAGKYVLRIAELLERGGNEFYYRLSLGELPYLTEVFPLGVQRGTVGRAFVRGYNLSGITEIQLDGRLSPTPDETLPLKVRTPLGDTLNHLKIVVGNYPEVLEQESDNEMSEPQKVTVPVTINGHINSVDDYDVYQFSARKGQVLAFEVMAQRLGSSLDSVIEILDLKGKPIPQAILQTVDQDLLDTALSSRSSVLGRLDRVRAPDLFPLDFLLIGERELVRLEEGRWKEKGYALAQALLGQRLAWLGTSPQNHHANARLYKVRIVPPNAKLGTSELPVVQLDYRNDDGGPIYGKDSYVLFTAPVEGDYLVRLQDIQNLADKRFAYRLTIRPATPDFRLFLDDGLIESLGGRPSGARNPNIPIGGHVALSVSAHRIDGFSGEIKVKMPDLPKGVHSTQGIIRENEYLTTLLLSALPTAPNMTIPKRLNIIGRAQLAGKEVARMAKDPRESLNLLSLAPPADITLTAVPSCLTIRPGDSAKFTLKLERHNGFAVDVPVQFRNLPLGVFVDLGVTGVEFTDEEDSRTITLVAETWVRPITFPIFAVGRVKSENYAKQKMIRMGESADYSSAPIIVTIQPKGLAPPR